MVKKIKVAELFYSIQGEGRYMGVPSVFLRTFGCNFKCEGFGMPKGEKSNERNEVKLEFVKKYEDLPLVSTGCDSYASWDPRFKHLSPLLTIDAIVDGIMRELPLGRWVQEHLVITGGEPLLGWQRAYGDLIFHPKMKDLSEITFETNGTQPLTTEFTQHLRMWNSMRTTPYTVWSDRLTFSVSPKLPVSGEKWEEAIRPDVVSQYADVGYTYLKFVVATEEDVKHAIQAVDEYRRHRLSHIPVYLMPVGGVESVYHLNNRRVAELAMKLGWRYSDRLQVPLFKNEWGT